MRWSAEMLDQYQGVFKSLSAHDVRYIVIGGIAAILHGVPRATFDLDILIDATTDNAKRLLRAFEQAGMGTATMTTAEDILKHEISIFKDWIRIDVQTRTPGTTFDEAWSRRNIMHHGQEHFAILSRDDLIATKRAAARPIDLSDIRALEAGSAPPMS